MLANVALAAEDRERNSRVRQPVPTPIIFNQPSSIQLTPINCPVSQTESQPQSSNQMVEPMSTETLSDTAISSINFEFKPFSTGTSDQTTSSELAIQPDENVLSAPETTQTDLDYPASENISEPTETIQTELTENVQETQNQETADETSTSNTGQNPQNALEQNPSVS